MCDPMASAATVEAVKRVLRESLRLGPQTPIADDAPLTGGDHDLDSLDVVLVVTTLEKEFGMKILDRSFDRRAFATVASLAEFIESRRG